MLCYEGIFFDKETSELIHSLEEERLAKVNDELHCTFKYRPDYKEIFDDIVGQYFEVYLIGYGCDGQNSGFEILLPKELERYYINYDKERPGVVTTPHITASIAEGARAVNTKNLKFRKLSEPVKLVGRFGYWIIDGEKEYVSYNPYFKKAGKTIKTKKRFY